MVATPVGLNGVRLSYWSHPTGPHSPELPQPRVTAPALGHSMRSPGQGDCLLGTRQTQLA